MTLHPNFSGMFLEDAVGAGKAEAGATGLALPRSILRGEERIVNSLNVLRRDARPSIRYAHADTVAVECGHAQPAPASHCVFGVQKQIQEHLLQSSRIALNGGQHWRERI